MVDVMAELKEKGVPSNDISHWCSDLYLRVTPTTKEIVSRYEFKNLVTTFIDNIDKVLWYEIPFAYYEIR